MSQEIPCRHFRLRNFKGMWNEPLEAKQLLQPRKMVLLSTEFGAEGQMCQLFAEGQSLQLWQYLKKRVFKFSSPIPRIGCRRFILPTFCQNFRHGALLQVSREIPCRHWRLRNFIEQRHVEWATLGKTTVSAVQIVLLSKEFGAEGQMCQFFSEGQSVQLWQYLRKDESSETYPGDKKANLKTCLERFDVRFRWHEIQTSDMGPFFKWKTACGMSRLHDCFSWAQIKSTQHHGIAQFFVST